MTIRYRRMGTPAANDELLEHAPLILGFRVLEPCVLCEKLGQGGMGAVYRGYHLNLDVEVAVKCLAFTGESGSHVNRFQREAAVAAKINATNLIRVYDVRYAHGLHYIVMELVDGESAADRVHRKGRLPVPEACAIALHAARGLAAAHAAGVIHRDIKPANILISKKGEVRVADLGIARADNPGTGLQTLVTDTRLVIGTPQYMPPEQFRGASKCTHRSDIYSLGAALWMMLVGQDPFSGLDFEGVEDAVIREGLADPRTLRNEIAEAVARIVLKATSRDAQDRFESAEAMARELEKYLATVNGPPSLADSMAGVEGTRVAGPSRELAKQIRTALLIPPTRTRGTPSSGQEPAPPPPKRFGAKIAVMVFAVAVVVAGVAVAVNLLNTAPATPTEPTPKEFATEKLEQIERALANEKLDAAKQALADLLGNQLVEAQDKAEGRQRIVNVLLKDLDADITELTQGGQWLKALDALDGAAREHATLLGARELDGRRNNVLDGYRQAMQERVEGLIAASQWGEIATLLAGLRSEGKLSMSVLEAWRRSAGQAELDALTALINEAAERGDQNEVKRLQALRNGSTLISADQRPNVTDGADLALGKFSFSEELRKGDFDAAERIINELESARHDTSELEAQLDEALHARFRQAIERHDLEGAEQWTGRIGSRGGEVDELQQEIDDARRKDVADAIDAGSLEQAERLLADLRQRGIDDGELQESLDNGYRKRVSDRIGAGDLDRARELLDELRQRGIEPGGLDDQLKRAHSTRIGDLIDAALQTGEFESAFEELEAHWRDAGLNSSQVADARARLLDAYTAAMRAEIRRLTSEKDWKRAFEYLAEVNGKARVEAEDFQAEVHRVIEGFKDDIRWVAPFYRESSVRIESFRESLEAISGRAPEASLLLVESLIWYKGQDLLTFLEPNRETVVKHLDRAKPFYPVSDFYLGDLNFRTRMGGRDGKGLNGDCFKAAINCYKLGRANEQADCVARLAQVALMGAAEDAKRALTDDVLKEMTGVGDPLALAAEAAAGGSGLGKFLYADIVVEMLRDPGRRSQVTAAMRSKARNFATDAQRLGFPNTAFLISVLDGP